ncbi:MAG: hypothetical protein IIA14_10875 [SAR324 cluster bacterium]|nr:hypothetical protein [SAR324 cluster bacterium]
MDIKEFPPVIGWLSRSYSPKPRGGYSEVVYRLSGDLQGSRYQALREIVFSVTEGESSPFEVCVNGEPVAEAHSMEGVSVELQSALDREFIRAGILAVAPEKGQQEPDLAMFQKPRTNELEPLKPPAGEEPGLFRNPRHTEPEPLKRPGESELEVFQNPRHGEVEPIRRARDPDLEGSQRRRREPD